MTDAIVAGSESAPLVSMGADQAQLDEYFRGLPVALNMDGTAMNEFYYNSMMVTMNHCRATTIYGRSRQGLNSTYFNSSAQVQLVIQNLISTVFLVLELATLPAYSALIRGWGLAAMRTLAYQLGNVNLGRIQIDYLSHYVHLMETIETAERRHFYLEKAGPLVINNTSTPLVGPFRAIIPIIFNPFSRVGGIHQKRPYDSTMQSSPMTLFFDFGSANQFICGAGAVAPNAPTQFSFGQVFLKEVEVFDKSRMYGSKLAAMPTMNYNYPFIYLQSYPTTVAQTSGHVSLTAQSIIDADLLGLGCFVRDQDNITSDGVRACNPFLMEVLQNVSIKFNNQVMLEGPGDMWQLYNAEGKYGSPAVPGAFIQGNATPIPVGPDLVSTFSPLAVSMYNLIWNVSFTPSLGFENHFPNTMRIGNQVLTVEFDLPNPNTRSYLAQFGYWFASLVVSQNKKAEIIF